MRVILTTVTNASVSIENKELSHIDHGYLLLVGFTNGDNQEIVIKMIEKILSLRVFPDSRGLTNLSLDEVEGDILSVSQFTLYGDVSDGRRPSFTHALSYKEAEELYNFFNSELEKRTTHRVETGLFGGDMKVTSTNEGPFTLILDSKELFKS